nr:NAD-dependent epimerase/dehydratase family protein [uncultured Anaerosporobacter sp.]
MKLLVTGSNGFIGKNLIATLDNIASGKDSSFHMEEKIIIYRYSHDEDKSLLGAYCKNADFVFHLAGVNRPDNNEDYKEGNLDFTVSLIKELEKYNNSCPILFASSIQAEKDNPYGRSKYSAEQRLQIHAKKMDSMVFIYRLPNVFGKWCKPNYNSVVTTFCYNIARNIPIQLNDPETILDLVYIDDVIEEMIRALMYPVDSAQLYYDIPTKYHVSLHEIASLLRGFYDGRKTQYIADIKPNSFAKKLYSTYLSYLPADDFGQYAKMNIDERGSFTELFKTINHGQISVNISKPGITKGEHWHHTKNEKFVVVSGTGLIQLRKYDTQDIIEYSASGEKIQIIDIPTGYTHNIINTGSTDLVTVMWCNECFDPQKPDTYYLRVNEKEE